MKAVISVKTQPKVKDQANKVANQLGIPLSTIMHALLLQFVREKRILLDLSSEKLSKRGEEMIEAALADKKQYAFNTPEEAIAMAEKLK